MTPTFLAEVRVEVEPATHVLRVTARIDTGQHAWLELMTVDVLTDALHAARRLRDADHGCGRDPR